MLIAHFTANKLNSDKRLALLFGLNYVCSSSSQARLKGCHHDVRSQANYLRDDRGYAEKDVRCHVDGLDNNGTCARGMSAALQDLVKATWSSAGAPEEVFIHYSGHGSKPLEHEQGDDDVAMVPWDYESNGVITMSYLTESVLKHMNPSTRVICVLDCCFSATSLAILGKVLTHVFHPNQPLPCSLSKENHHDHHGGTCVKKAIIVAITASSRTSISRIRMIQENHIQSKPRRNENSAHTSEQQSLAAKQLQNIRTMHSRCYNCGLSSSLVRVARRCCREGVRRLPLFSLVDLLNTELTQNSVDAVPSLFCSTQEGGELLLTRLCYTNS